MAGTLGHLTHMAWFLTDDTFGSFHYACNLLKATGWVFNPGKRATPTSCGSWIWSR